ncbi:Peptidoglycan-binding domain 1 protein [[Leptolyngbya] sp. PCC 7376]|uniref:peptidoglycan-binding domain-containing protein n=1 Tax=[Leptolyngbya] sp. PCC 7376 TaxID=111781 RepID=UPI00029F1782|nr:peptidoglycan-binding domain-containing protein [[Leptolyngbya] sp. PCC 7376]AFY39261.1 Peptidoglycan-binding domain 1 protein [[Leptolyngbya] sp. PCC 7376]
MANLTSELSPQAVAVINRLEPETLQMGDRSPAVEILQDALAKLHFFNGSADGVYGIKTANGVRRVQRHLGLDDTGIFDHNTWYGMTYWSNDLVIDQPPASSNRPWSPFKRVAKLFGI